MGTLLIDEDLLSSDEDDEARYLARALTLALLRRADGAQKRSVVEFLAESGLAGSSDPGSDIEPVVSVANADLSGADLVLLDYLQGVDLTETNLSNTALLRINLSEAVLPRGNLNEADLTGTNLQQADLNEAILSSANLQQADLSGADLNGANLEGADLSGANLEGAEGVTVEELEEQARSLEGTTTPDGTEHD
ncbi:MAG: pentapeptide repeat-containing protein [Actinobacteria bacterium]|nr:pentapeptide repeat-containing protein [Actinomycetota bacterium]